MGRLCLAGLLLKVGVTIGSCELSSGKLKLK